LICELARVNRTNRSGHAGLVLNRRCSIDITDGLRTGKRGSQTSGAKWLTFGRSLEPSRSARRRSGTRAFLDGRAEVARMQTANTPSLVLVASACLQQPPGRDRRCRIDTRKPAHFREYGHHRARMGPTVIITRNPAGGTRGAQPERTRSLSRHCCVSPVFQPRERHGDSGLPGRMP
jgi:hypothetical protein